MYWLSPGADALAPYISTLDVYGPKQHSNDISCSHLLTRSPAQNMPSWTPFKFFVPDDALTLLRCKLSDPRFLDNIDDAAWEYGVQSGVSSAYYHAVVVARSGTDRTLRALPYCPHASASVDPQTGVMYPHGCPRRVDDSHSPRKRAHPPSRHPRPGLPTPPARSQTQTPRTLRRPHSGKVEEVHRSRTLPRSAVSAVDLRAYAHEGGGIGGVGDDRRSMMRHSDQRPQWWYRSESCCGRV
jgi:hypothetical protein